MQYFWTLWYLFGHFLFRRISLPSFYHTRTINHFSDPDNFPTSTANPNIPLSSICMSGILKEIGVTILIRIECRSDLYWVYSLADPGGALLAANVNEFSYLLPLPPLTKSTLPKVKSWIRHWVDHIFNFFTITPSPAVPIEKCISKYLTYIADITLKATPSQIHLNNNIC